MSVAYPKRLPTPTKRKGAHTYEIRVRVPPKSRGGKFKGHQTTRSLRTRDKAEAFRSLGRVYDALMAEFDAEAGIRTPTPPVPKATKTTPLVPVLSVDEVCRLYRERIIASEHQSRLETINSYRSASPLSPYGQSYDTLKLADNFRNRVVERLERCRAKAVVQEFDNEAWFLNFLEHNKQGSVEDRGIALAALLQAQIAALKEIIAIDGGQSPASAFQGADIRQDAPLLSEHHKAFAKGRNDLTSERVAIIAATVRDFIEVCGDKPVNDYSRADGARFVDLLSELPANKNKHPQLRKLSVVDAAKKAMEIGLSPQSTKSIRKKIALLKAVFAAAEERYDSVEIAFPMKTLPKAKQANEQKDPFTEDELKVLLGSTLTGHLFWLTWLGLYTGARLNELCQLVRSNIKQHDGLHYIAITPDQRLKTPSSERSIPIHPKLLELGFLDYVNALAQDSLFPGVPQHSSGRYSDAPSKAFTRHLRKIGLKRAGLSFHSLRHTFAAKLKTAAPRDGETRERLLGHALPGLAARYGGSYASEAGDMTLLQDRANVIASIGF